jgi:hypothetical protein
MVNVKHSKIINEKEIKIMKYMNINGEVFPYEEPKYNDTYAPITGKHLFINMMPTQIPEKYAVKLTGIINVQDMAEAKVLRDNPEYEELTMYNTRKAGYWKLVKEQTRKTLYWALNKQPASLTIFTNVISGMGNTEPTASYTVYGLTQLCMQLGVVTQIVNPDTAYVCRVEPVCNKKQLPIFTKAFVCETLYRAHIDGVLPEEFKDRVDEIKAKCERLQDYRKTIQDHIWEQVNIRLSEYRDEWKEQNLYTLPDRMGYAINKLVEDTLLAYRRSFNIPASNALTLDDLRDPALYNKIIATVGHYAAPFGIRVKVTERTSDFGTYTPKDWLRDDKGTITEAVLLRRALKQQQNMKPDTLNDILTAYMQIDYYLSLEDFSEFLAEGYSVCGCGEILNNREDKVCPKCGAVNYNYEPQTVPYNTIEDCAMNNWSEYTEE